MVNSWTGEWTAEKDYTNYPAEKWCDCDRIAAWIIDSNYQIKTTMENLVSMILAYFDSPDERAETEKYKNNPSFIEIIRAYVENSGGLSEFDYEI